jgi:hypothetical protein
MTNPAPKHPKRPRDPAQLAKLMVDIATGEVEDAPNPVDEGKDPSAVSLGRRGGLIGGHARAEKLGKERRAEIARRAAEVRWKKD